MDVASQRAVSSASHYEPLGSFNMPIAKPLLPLLPLTQLAKHQGVQLCAAA
jgi:hypothetical protein